MPSKTAFLALFLLSNVPLAQLDLPKRRPAPAGGGEEPPGRTGEGVELPSRPRGDLGPGGGDRDLDIPRGDPGATPAPAAPALAPVPGPLEGPAAAFEAVRGTRHLDPLSMATVAERLLAMGPEGLSVARIALEGDEVGPLLSAGRHLVLHGEAADRALVAQRLRRSVPPSAATNLLETLVQSDPVTAAPSFLVELLDHSQSAIRQAAHRVLQDRADASLLPYLAVRLESHRSDTRLRALELLEGIEDPGALQLAATRLSDSTAKVAARAVQTFVRRMEPRSGELLRELAFGDKTSERGRAYALLALVEREDRHGHSEFTLEDVPALLRGLRAGEVIVTGASAAALAGIGFRTPASPATAWLDLEVPHTLIRLGSGAEFHRDFTSLQPVALRRLALLSGERFGGDGVAWRRWWTESAGDFHARRAAISAAPGDEFGLSVEAETSTGVLRLAGPESPLASNPDVVLLTRDDCRALLDLLSREGVLGLERVPARLGTAGAKRLIVTVGEQEKRFEFSPTTVPPWAQRVLAEHQALADRHAWQRYHVADSSGESRAAFVEREGAFWAEEHTAIEKDRRLKGLVMAALANQPLDQRDLGIAELRRLYRIPEVVDAADTAPLMGLAMEETRSGTRQTELFELLFVALSERESDRFTTEETGGLLEFFVRNGDSGVETVGRVLSFSEESALSDAATSHDGLVRQAAAQAAADAGRLDLLFLLAEDFDTAIAAGAVEGLGGVPTEEVRAFLLSLADSAPRKLLSAVFCSIGRVGGEGARDALMLGFADDDSLVQRSAVEGFAELADPVTTSMLISVLGRDLGPSWTEPARRGLLRIGEPAWPQLLRVMNAKNSRSRREAALLLAEQGVPDAAPVLITLLTVDPTDERVAEELAILSGVDHRASEDPSQGWWEWWDLVVHDDALAWLCAAAEREGSRAPAIETLREEGTREGALFLVDLLGPRSPRHLSVRARRELGRLLNRPIPALAESTADRDAEHAALVRSVEAHFAGGTKSR